MYLTGTATDALRKLCDNARDKAPASVTAVIGEAEGKTTLAVAVGKEAQARGLAAGKLVKEFLIFIISAFMASLCASAALRFDCTAETALATSVLYLVPGVPLINGVIDIVEGHILIGFSRLINALLLIICIAIGLSATLLMVKNSLL